MKYAIGLDLGTSAVKGILADENENIIASAECKFYYSSPNPNEVISDADDFLSSCYDVLRTLSKSLPTDSELVAVCEASASGNLLLLDENNNPISPIYNWQDKRTTTETADVLGTELADNIFNIVGWGCKTVMPLAVLCWLKVHEPEMLKKAYFVTMSTEYLNYKLCNAWGVSPSAGTPFHLIEQEKGQYYKPYLDKLGITEDMLPPILPIGEQIGTVTKEASELTGLPVGTPIKLGTFDHIAGGIGSGVTKPGQMMLSCGTSWVFFIPTKERSASVKAKLLTDPFLSSFGGSWCCMKSLPSIAHNINEYVFRYISNEKDCFAKLDEYCLAADKDANGLMIDPFVHPDDAADLSGYDKTDIARAIMVGVSTKLKETFKMLEGIGVFAESVVMVGGPSRSKVWQSVISEITGVEVKPAIGAFTGALGAAKIAFRLKL